MVKEWKKSRSSARSLNDLVGIGLLHSQELDGWRAPEGESYPDPRAGEIVVFEDFSRGALGFLSILFSRLSFFTMRSGLQPAPELNSSYFHFHPSVRGLCWNRAALRSFPLSFLFEEEGSGWRLQDWRWSIPQSS